MSAQLHLSDVLHRFLPHYIEQHSITSRQRQVSQHILDCRTAKLGTQHWQCDHCDYERIQYCACRDRHCPRCQGVQRQQWVDKQQEQALPTRYFHLVFTLPHELNVISRYKPKALYQSLFQAVWQTLSKFAKNRKLKGQLGITAVLHTWGQSLSQHIHLHCLVPAGVLTQQQHWHENQSNYLYPVKALSTVFRAKMLAALRTQRITIPEQDTLMNKAWCVYSKPCLNHLDTVIQYLGRYTQKGMFDESRFINITDNTVTFTYKDYRHNNQTKSMQVSGEEFIRRYLQHVLPKGLMRVRHFGYLANRCRRKKLKVIKAQCKPTPNLKTKRTKQAEANWPCPKCQHGILRLHGLALPEKTDCLIEAAPPFRLTG